MMPNWIKHTYIFALKHKGDLNHIYISLNGISAWLNTSSHVPVPPSSKNDINVQEYINRLKENE